MKHAVTVAIFAGVTFFSAGGAGAETLGQGGMRAGVFQDVENDRISGFDVSAYGDIRGIGMTMGLDYHNAARIVGDGKFFAHSVGLSIGFRFSPVAFVDAERALKYFDAYGAAVANGGMVVRKGRTDRGSRASSYLAVGVELRTNSKRFPAIVLEHQWRERGDEYAVGNTMLIGVALVGSGRSQIRD